MTDSDDGVFFLHRREARRAGFGFAAFEDLRAQSAPLVAGAYTLQFAQERNWISSTTANDLGYQAIVAGLWLMLITFRNGPPTSANTGGKRAT